jgi:hypothetical protein
MNPVRLWFGLVFVAMGILAILAGTGTIAWSQTFEEWWPVAIVGWGVADMLAAHRISLGSAIIAAIGITLLAAEQGWSGEAFVWSMLFLLIGTAILIPGTRRKDAGANDRARSSVTPASQP